VRLAARDTAVQLFCARLACSTGDVGIAARVPELKELADFDLSQ
jgi:hypothetical protein